MQSNIRRERPKRPDPPCTICRGTGKIDCRNCFGRGISCTPCSLLLLVSWSYKPVLSWPWNLGFTGRTNHADLVMLPKGEWPQWWGAHSLILKSCLPYLCCWYWETCFSGMTSISRCRICGGSGLDYCHRCHGTGEFREPMGFHFATIHRKWTSPRQCCMVDSPTDLCREIIITSWYTVQRVEHY